MNFKEAIEKELEINPKIDFEEANLRIEGLKEKTFNNVRTGWKKNNGNKSHGPDDNGKNSRKNSRNKNATNNNLEKGLDDFTSLNSKSLEKLLVKALKKQPDNANLIGKAIDFFIKVKDKTDGADFDVNLEELLRLGIVTRYEGSPREDHDKQEIPELYRKQ